MYFAEAFKALDCLTEDTFSTSAEDLEALKKMADDDDAVFDEVEIYDTTATTDEELQDSYIGKVIMDCCTCHSLFYKTPDEIVIDEEQDVANIDEECPICASVGGYKIIGEVAPFEKETATQIDAVEEPEEHIQEAFEKKNKKELYTVSVKEDNGKWTPVHSFATKEDAVRFRDEYQEEHPDSKYMVHTGAKFESLSESKSIKEGIFGIKTKKEKAAEEKARKEREAKKKADKEAAEEREYARQQAAADSWSRHDQNKREAQRQYNNNRYNNIKGDKPSNTGHKGVNYSGGDYYSESKSIKESSSEVPDTFYIGWAETDIDKFHDYMTKNPTLKIYKRGSDYYVATSEDDTYGHQVDNSIVNTLKQDSRFKNLFVESKSIKEGIFGSKKKELYTISMKEKDGKWKPVHSFNNKQDAVKFKADYEKDHPDVKYMLHTGKKFESLTADTEVLDKSLNESIKDLSITTEDTKLEMTSDEAGKVTVTSEPVADSEGSGEMIAPLSDETASEIEAAADQTAFEDGEELDIDVEEFDEESFDELGESLLKENYTNVKSFKTRRVTERNNKLFVEGVIGFTSGKKGKTTFILENAAIDSTNRVQFSAKNRELTEAIKLPSVYGSLEGKRVIFEKLSK